MDTHDCPGSGPDPDRCRIEYVREHQAGLPAGAGHVPDAIDRSCHHGLPVTRNIDGGLSADEPH